MDDTVESARRSARARLTETSDSPDLEARRLLEHGLGVGPAYCITHPDRRLTADESARFDALLAHRLAGEPIAYLTGEIGFWTLDLWVDRRVLIPRPDTETLVETVLGRLRDGPARVADLGTGSGAIALALASERPAWQLWATDADADALACARSNARRLGLSNLHFVEGDWLTPLAGQGFDAIVANPPYIDPADVHLRAPALAFEPRNALVAADRGLAELARIAAEAPAHLLAGGWLLLEHGFDQDTAVQDLLRPCFDSIGTAVDLGGRPRVTFGRVKAGLIPT